MDILTLLAVLALILLIFMFLPDILPYCQCCKKVKLRLLFRIHKPKGVLPGHSGNISICKKCCKKYCLDSIEEYKTIRDIKRKIETQVSLMKKDIE